MRMGNHLRLFVCLFTLTFWHTAAMADITWSHREAGLSGYSSVPSICVALQPFMSAASGQPLTYAYHEMRSTDARCRFKTATGQTNGEAYVRKDGAACDPGEEYDPDIGECAAPETTCSAKQGETMNWSKSGSAGDGYGSLTQINGKPMFLPGMNACFSGCAVETTDRRCVSRVNGDYFCRGSGEYTGEECPQGAPTGSDLVPEDAIETPEPQNLKDEQPCIYAADGSKEVCTSSKTDEVEGQICATLEDGSEFCTTKLPEKNGIDIRTEVTKEILADGSVKTTKKDTATVTKCVGVNNCTTTKAETTKTTTEDANGNKTGESSTCKGEACPGKGNPDSDGDGVGDCTGDDCGAGGGGEGQDWYTPTGDTFGSVLTEFVGKVQQTPVASQTSSFLTFRATGSCPRWSVSVWVFDIDIDQLCNGDIPWNAIKAVILAAAGFFAFRIALL